MRLAPAGNGLPSFERKFIKVILIPIAQKVFTWDLALYMFKKEVDKINRLLKKIPNQRLTQEIIIDRVFGIEDDSRRYSINMVLEHLTIVGSGIQQLIDTLSKEKAFEREVSIEAVKPQHNEDYLEKFNQFSDSYIKFIKTLEKKKSKMTKKHPWFVEFNNFDWSIFVYIHTMVHRRQIQRIISGLGL
ncbi:MAG: hypothetical protein FNT15_06360 [Sulfurovum sp.]|nr:MAG: hypothetical protein FNT15_06360 [Sulfurovum sp.]